MRKSTRSSVSEIANQKIQRQPTDKELTDEAVAMLKRCFRASIRILSRYGERVRGRYMDGWINGRSRQRQGFPPDVLRALLVSRRIHFQTFGTFKKIDPWDIGLKT